jgi:hypothetical protein
MHAYTQALQARYLLAASPILNKDQADDKRLVAILHAQTQILLDEILSPIITTPTSDLPEITSSIPLTDLERLFKGKSSVSIMIDIKSCLSTLPSELAISNKGVYRESLDQSNTLISDFLSRHNNEVGKVMLNPIVNGLDQGTCKSS